MYTNSIHRIRFNSMRFKGIVTHGQHSIYIGPTTGNCIIFPTAYCIRTCVVLYFAVVPPCPHCCCCCRHATGTDGTGRRKDDHSSNHFRVPQYFITKPQQQQHHVDVLAAAGIQYYNVINRRRALIIISMEQECVSVALLSGYNKDGKGKIKKANTCVIDG